MGRIALPPITKIETVLDLITDPAKYKAYLEEFKSIYDEAQLSLGNLDTKEKADAHLAKAEEAHAYAERSRTKAEAELRASVDKAATIEADMLDKQGASSKRIEEESKALDARSKELNRLKAEFDAYENATRKILTDKQTELAGKEAALNKLEAILSAKQAKFEAALSNT